MSIWTKKKGTDILTVAPERTFWEKATILHHEANRPEHLEMPQRYSRHYYDLYRIAAAPVKRAAFSQPDLLKKVVDFKMKFYPRGWAKYQEAVPGTLKLLPPAYRFPALEADYDAMKDTLSSTAIFSIPSYCFRMTSTYLFHQKCAATRKAKINFPLSLPFHPVFHIRLISLIHTVIL